MTKLNLIAEPGKQEIVSPERLVYTFEFEGMQGHVLLESDTFSDRN